MTPFNRDLNFDLCHPLTVFSLADINSGVIWMDCRPLKRDRSYFTLIGILESKQQYCFLAALMVHLYDIGIICLSGHQLQGGALTFPRQHWAWPACGVTLH